MVKFTCDPGYWHERLLLWPCLTGGGREGDSWYVLTADGDFYAECAGDYSRSIDIDHSTNEFGREVTGNLIQFDEEVPLEELNSLIRRARVAAVSERSHHPDRRVPPDPTEVVDWHGNRTPIPALGVLDRVSGARRRLAGKSVGEGIRSRFAGSAGTLVASGDIGGASALVAGESAVNLTATSVDLSAGEGFAWVESEPLVGLGQVVLLGGGSLVSSDRAWALSIQTSGSFRPVERVKIEDAGSYVQRRVEGFTALDAGFSRAGAKEADLRDRFALFADEKDTAAQTAGKGLDGEEDVRTLWIDYDFQGERFKEWRNVCQEASEHRYKDAPVPSPSVGVALCKHFFKHGGDPESWLNVWMREKNLEQNDRVVHEMRVLVRAYKHGCSYDQLNPGACVIFEVLGRRILAVVDAYSANASRPNWDLARFFTGSASSDEGLCIEVRAAAAKQAKEEYELSVARNKARELRGPSGSSDYVASSEKVEGDGGRGRGRGRGGGRGRGLTATPPAQ
jgi:hypothetical protein